MEGDLLLFSNVFHVCHVDTSVHTTHHVVGCRIQCEAVCWPVKQAQNHKYSAKIPQIRSDPNLR